MDTNNITPLCELGYKYGTDKCPQLRHSYTRYYYELFKDRRDTVKKVFEMGIGKYKGMGKADKILLDWAGIYYHIGASLKMWRDFFPNATVYGADILPDALFTDERIQTFLCDSNNKEQVEELIRKVGTDIDIFIDDGSHKKDHQIFLVRTVLPLLKKDAIYIIEDVAYHYSMPRILSEFDCFSPDIPAKTPADRLLVVRQKQ